MSTYTDLLRAVADLIEKHDLPSDFASVGESYVSVAFYGDNSLAGMNMWRHAIGGTWEKQSAPYLDERLQLTQKAKTLPGTALVILEIAKQNCVRKVIGTETVVIPAVEASPERTEEREIIEWECGSVLEGVAA